MRGVLGELKRGSYTYFDLVDRDMKQRERPLPIIKHIKAANLLGYFVPYQDTNIKEVKLEYRDIINKCHLIIKRDLTRPRVKVFVKLAGSDLEVPELFIEDHIYIDKLTVLPTYNQIDVKVINQHLADGKKCNLWNKLMFQKTGDSVIRQVVKQSSLGEIKRIEKKISGVEL